jgi:hypothetical protein
MSTLDALRDSLLVRIIRTVSASTVPAASIPDKSFVYAEEIEDLYQRKIFSPCQV